MTSLCGRVALTPLLAAVSFLAFAAATVTAAPLQRDLGHGLVYFRVANAPADLPRDTATAKQPCVLDLRYARADAGAGQQLGAWLADRAGPKHPVFVLANNSTAPVLLHALVGASGIPGVMTIGISSPQFSPEFPVFQSPVDELSAFEALANGASVAAVTTDNPNKQRNDEASLSRETQPEDAAADTEKDPKEATKAPARIDAALQRAIHLHRGLQALKRID